MSPQLHHRPFIAGVIVTALTFQFPAAAQESKPTAEVPKTVPALKLTPGGQGNATPPSQEVLGKRRADKLAKPVFKNADWVLDYDAARKRAKAEGKLILTYFTRSYAG